MKVTTITTDWLAIESDYRAGLLSLRAIAAKNGAVTEGAIRKRARKLEWARDLTARIRAKATELMRTASVRSTGPQYATNSATVETDIVNANAEFLAHIEVTQRRNILRARTIVSGLFAELERTIGDRSVELIRDPSQLPTASVRDNSGVNATGAVACNGGLSLSARADAAKKLADALRTLVGMERQAWGMDDPEPDTGNAGRVLDSSKLTWQEREQLRAMILRASEREPAAIAGQSPD